MKPTTLKTETTKTLCELSRADHGATIDIGGVTHNIKRRADGFSLQCNRVDGERGCLAGGASPGALSPDAQVTVTETRPMEARDLRVGDAFVVDEGDGRESVCICIDDSGTGHIRVLRIGDNEVTRRQIAFRRTEVMLVDLTFDAEPVEGERTVPVDDIIDAVERVELWGHICMKVGHSPEWVWIEWQDVCGHPERAALPRDTPVTVREPATYESWHDVSAGDVFLFDEKAPGIYLRNGKGLASDGCLSEVINPANLPSDLTPARLTHVDYTPREEVSR